MLQFGASLTENSISVNYDRNMFIIQVTDLLLFILRISFTFFIKQPTLTRRATIGSLPLLPSVNLRERLDTLPLSGAPRDSPELGSRAAFITQAPGQHS